MRIIFSITSVLIFCTLFSCIDKDFDTPGRVCNETLVPNISIKEIQDSFTGDDVIEISEEWIVEGVVISNDQTGNIFGKLYIQDKEEDAEAGFLLEIDLFDSYLFYPEGSGVLMKLKGLSLGEENGIYKIGSVLSVFGNKIIGRLPALKAKEHLLVNCEKPNSAKPLTTTISALSDTMLNTLIRIDSLEVVPEEIGQTFAEDEKETIRKLTDCKGKEIDLVNSGYSDFQEEIFPLLNGSITGILQKKRNKYYLLINDPQSIDFTNDRCTRLIQETTTNEVFFSELADPDNNSGARFVELFNSGVDGVDLLGWKIKRYTNANTESSTFIDLSDMRIEAKSTLIISPNATVFEEVYGFPPDMSVSPGGPADSNGDDNLELVDPFGTVIDLFGLIGEDGSGTNHEFEDGRANRKSDVVLANPLFTFSEWDIWNDTGEGGTINLPQKAPQDFTPGIR